jgi:hypothetical protein
LRGVRISEDKLDATPRRFLKHMRNGRRTEFRIPGRCTNLLPLRVRGKKKENEFHKQYLYLRDANYNVVVECLLHESPILLNILNILF